MLEAHYLRTAQDSWPDITKPVAHAFWQLVQKFVFVSHQLAGVTMAKPDTLVAVGIQHIAQHMSRSVIQNEVLTYFYFKMFSRIYSSIYYNTTTVKIFIYGSVDTCFEYEVIAVSFE